MISVSLLRLAMPFASTRRVNEFAPLLESARKQWVGDDFHQIAMWLAQIAHESGSLHFLKEIASGDDYEGRKDLGNTEPGDGRRFKGRGLLQVTGRKNYQRCGKALNLDLISFPHFLEYPIHAANSAGWVWVDHGLGELCIAKDPVLAVTRRLNGGVNGLEQRRKLYVVALAAVKAEG